MDGLYDNFYEDFFLKYGIDYSNMQRGPNFMNIYRLVRILSEVVPYWCQIVLTIALAVERYILIVLGARAEMMLSKRNRLVFYSAVILLSLAPSVVLSLSGFFRTTQEVS